MVTYIVWIGGIADYEGNSLTQAQSVFDLWTRLGYDDVILEELQ